MEDSSCCYATPEQRLPARFPCNSHRPSVRRTTSSKGPEPEKPRTCPQNLSPRSSRPINFGPARARELAKHILASAYSKDEDFVFATETGRRSITETPARPRSRQSCADKAGLNPGRAAAALVPRLRHTAITHLIRGGADVAQVSRFAGHSKVSTTLGLFVGKFEALRSNDSGQRLAAVYAGVLG
jgi:hypothetical protein